MVVRKAEGSLTKPERGIIKALLSKGWRNQDIQALINIGRIATINSARITEVKNLAIAPASNEDVEFFIKRKNSYDYKTGLNLYDDERLIRSREAMILAVHVFNNPSIQFKTEVFAVQANIAWTYLLHEYYDRKKVKIIDDSGRSLLLSQMIKREDSPLSKGTKNNIQDLIDIRNDVEHKLLKRADVKFFAKFQTCCLNFDKAISDLFGEQLSLKNELSLALQFAKVDFGQIELLNKYEIPSYIEALDARLEGRLSEEERADLEYQFRVVYTLESSTKKNAHIQFIKPGSEAGVEIHNVLEKFKISDELYPYKSGQVCSEVANKTGKRFNQHTHRQACKYFALIPDRKKTPSNTDKKFCIYHPTFKSFTYSQAWIDRLITASSNPPEWEKILKIRL